MNGKDAMLLEQALGKGGIRLRADYPPEPERRDRAMRRGIVRRQYLEAGDRPRLV